MVLVALATTATRLFLRWMKYVLVLSAATMISSFDGKGDVGVGDVGVMAHAKSESNITRYFIQQICKTFGHSTIAPDYIYQRNK